MNEKYLFLINIYRYPKSHKTRTKIIRLCLIKPNYQLDEELRLDPPRGLVLCVRPLGEKGIYLVYKDHCRLVNLGHPEKGSNHFFTLTYLSEAQNIPQLMIIKCK